MNQQAGLTRREVLGTTAVSALGGLTIPDDKKPRTFVLVHGAWHGGWCWKKVVPLLRALGHDVFTPTLTGLGERSHLLNPEIDLNTHVQDVAAVLEYEDLQNVILVGHSYSGMVITGTAGKAARRIGHLVYLDSFLPENGKSLSDYSPRSPAELKEWRMPPKSLTFGVADEHDVAWMKTRISDHPSKTFTQPVQFSVESYDKLPKTYILCTKTPFFVEAGERAKRSGFRFKELLSAGHDAMITQPNELVKLLLEAT